MSAEVRRDALGVPHLQADDVMELARLQGRVTALDRGWQVEHHRWRMEGRTAEYVGADGLAWDRFARQVRLEPTVQRCFERLDPETRTWLTAYVDGVNDTLADGLAGTPEVAVVEELDDAALEADVGEPVTRVHGSQADARIGPEPLEALAPGVHVDDDPAVLHEVPRRNRDGRPVRAHTADRGVVGTGQELDHLGGHRGSGHGAQTSS